MTMRYVYYSWDAELPNTCTQQITSFFLFSPPFSYLSLPLAGFPCSYIENENNGDTYQSTYT